MSAVLKLRYENLELAKSKKRPHGAIAWPSASDKMGKAWSAPIDPEVRATLERILRDRPGIGSAYLFRLRGDEPVPYGTARRWLLEAERLAELPKQEGSLWHAYRRAWGDGAEASAVAGRGPGGRVGEHRDATALLPAAR